MKAVLLTSFALLCFAFNSILCRLALRGEGIDAASFTAVRIISGAIVLYILAAAFSKESGKSGSWRSALFLFGYAAAFSFAYLSLTAATGALMLFGAVQLTMVAVSIARGERPRRFEWIGMAVAFGGLIYLVLPGLQAPPLVSSALMIAAGAAWGFYTLSGKGIPDPLAATSGNFARAVPFALIPLAFFAGSLKIDAHGAMLAALSGAVASGVGYAVWYAALKYHSATRAAVLQLSVPAIAAVGGIVFLAESFTARFAIASVLIIGGIGLTILGRRR